MSIPADLVSRLETLMRGELKLFLDYDGTLVPIRMDPDDCYPDEELKEILSSLYSRYDTYIVTGRSLEDITRFIGHDYNVIALHGAVTRIKGKVSESVGGMGYFRQVCDNIFANRELFEKRYDGLRMYNKNGNLLFHLGLIPEQSKRDEVIDAVRRMAVENMMETYEGKMIVELRVPGINKGKAIREIRNGSQAVIAGDDRTDEDSFAVNQDALRIRIGEGITLADFTLHDYREMRDLLKRL